MAEQWWETDEGLQGALREALAEEHVVPESFLEMARATYTWRSVDSELAALAYDSASERLRSEALTVRAEPAVLRAMTFSSPRLTIELMFSDDAMLGQLVPPQPGRVEVQTADGESITVAADGVGWFSVRPVPTRMCRLRCTLDGGPLVETTWMVP